MTSEKEPVRLRSWCFTDYNKENLKKGYSLVPEIRGIAWGLETCPSTGRLHNQGYIQCFEKQSVKRIQKWLNSNCHLEPMYGSILQNENYCSKEHKYNKLGEFVAQGQRCDLQEFYELIKTKSDYELLEEGHASQFIRNHNAVAKIRSILLKEKAKQARWRVLDVIILLGKAGCGKSKMVHQNNDNVFMVDYDQKFIFDGYEGEDIILIEEFNGQIKYNYLLKMLDGHPLPLNVKFGRSHALYTKVYITSNVHPLRWYNNVRDNLKRRCPKLLLGNTNQEQFSEVENFWENKEIFHEYSNEYS